MIFHLKFSIESNIFIIKFSVSTRNRHPLPVEFRALLFNEINLWQATDFYAPSPNSLVFFSFALTNILFVKMQHLSGPNEKEKLSQLSSSFELRWRESHSVRIASRLNVWFMAFERTKRNETKLIPDLATSEREVKNRCFDELKQACQIISSTLSWHIFIAFNYRIGFYLERALRTRIYYSWLSVSVSEFGRKFMWNMESGNMTLIMVCMILK